MLTSDYLPNIGGIASHVYQLSLHLMRMGQEVEVWYWDRGGIEPALDEAERHLHRLGRRTADAGAEGH